MNVVKRNRKLGKLKSQLDRLAGSDRNFVREMVSMLERGGGYAAATVVFTSPNNVVSRYMPLEQLFSFHSKRALHLSPLAVMEEMSTKLHLLANGSRSIRAPFARPGWPFMAFGVIRGPACR